MGRLRATTKAMQRAATVRTGGYWRTGDADDQAIREIREAGDAAMREGDLPDEARTAAPSQRGLGVLARLRGWLTRH